MKFRADGASRPGGGLMTAARELKAALGDLGRNERPEIHLIGHSAGAIMHGNFLAAMKAQELKASSIQLWRRRARSSFATPKYAAAFASRVADPKTTYVEVLSDDNEKSDPCIPVLYSKSLLYLVSLALEPDTRRRCWAAAGLVKPPRTMTPSCKGTRRSLTRGKKRAPA